MGTLKIQHAVDAASSMQALLDVMSEELHQIEAGIQELTSCTQESSHVAEEIATHVRARAALHGGMASIRDILGWVRLMTERDVNGDEYITMWPLPTVPASPIN